MKPQPPLSVVDNDNGDNNDVAVAERRKPVAVDEFQVSIANLSLLGLRWSLIPMPEVRTDIQGHYEARPPFRHSLFTPFPICSSPPPSLVSPHVLQFLIGQWASLIFKTLCSALQAPILDQSSASPSERPGYQVQANGSRCFDQASDRDGPSVPCLHFSGLAPLYSVPRVCFCAIPARAAISVGRKPTADISSTQQLWATRRGTRLRNDPWVPLGLLSYALLGHSSVLGPAPLHPNGTPSAGFGGPVPRTEKTVDLTAGGGGRLGRHAGGSAQPGCIRCINYAITGTDTGVDLGRPVCQRSQDRTNRLSLGVPCDRNRARRTNVMDALPSEKIRQTRDDIEGLCLTVRPGTDSAAPVPGFPSARRGAQVHCQGNLMLLDTGLHPSLYVVYS
ncbi:hypothetical protein CH63R_12589 [Colletotrichum higginsianum IMI 349063]|uniref:Uncharacterized protein n=1 Tax=Colletotrichum higginsianum (strain IMI 349063) TaxID=759273 RepID=A0A1B7XUK8_COLHI|nr:hypothetical protein CH63R_12589 [Colletotrichum higginsianum IMI 349063]OBR03462.1 hypothetical protein CH63R_12589 [Colletotrichum higginsianum IMI 349063]